MSYEYLNTVKAMIGITGNYHDETLNAYADEVIEFMVDSGVALEVALSKKTIGTVARGISDLWNLGAGNASLSPYFKNRVIQLSYSYENKIKVNNNV